MQRDFNNNIFNITDIYNSQNATNLTVSLLPTKTDVATSIANNNLNYTTTSGINTLLTSTIASQVIARDNAVALAITNNNLNYTTTGGINTLLSSTITQQISDRNTAVALAITNNNLNYTTSLLTATLINNNIISNNLLYTSTINLNTLLANAVTSRDAAIALSSSNNNTLSTAYTNTKINTEITRADAAIASAITTNNLLYTPSSSIGIGSQFNSVSIGTNTKLYNGFSCAYGFNAVSSGYSIGIGYNAGSVSNANNTSCCFIGANSGITQGSTFTNSVALGSGSFINSSNQVMLGDSLSTAYSANITTPNLIATTATINNLNINGTTTYNYSSLSGVSSFKNQGFSSTSSNLKNIYAYETFYNCNTITLPCGVYFINYKFELNYNVSQINYFLNFGLGSTSLLLDLQQNKNYCSSAGNITSTYNCSNSYCFVSTNGSVIYQNVMMNAFDNTISVANLSQFIISAKMTAIRLA